MTSKTLSPTPVKIQVLSLETQKKGPAGAGGEAAASRVGEERSPPTCSHPARMLLWAPCSSSVKKAFSQDTSQSRMTLEPPSIKDHSTTLTRSHKLSKKGTGEACDQDSPEG